MHLQVEFDIVPQHLSFHFISHQKNLISLKPTTLTKALAGREIVKSKAKGLGKQKREEVG